MVCGICRQAGHNRQTCPQRRALGLPIQRTTGIPPPPAHPPSLSVTNRSSIIRKWKNAIKDVIKIHKFVIIGSWMRDNLPNEEWDIRIVYLTWLKVKSPDLINKCIKFYNGRLDPGIIQRNITECIQFHQQRSPPPRAKDDRRMVEFMNLRKENYLVYWVVGNYLVEDIDIRENAVNYMGMIIKGDKFKCKTMNGHRFYLVPYRLNTEPPYHPRTDKEFFIEPYCQVNIHEGIEGKIFIDKEDTLSEMNRWKFNALKLDYLIKEVIKLGGKNNDILECVLDLHEDIKLDSVTEMEKEMAGIPSTFTNIS